ncbi:hypothetical protein GWI33_008207 [Rhynchophorus ferrugineus]|uniref:Uncharacterized protein n=1 Tax=Rhynchophorus ferrugineus TaxID=354439 RepID=A0A834IIP4_RHYFE|nr:hypothetical protein GWI33_008207 [Rhynchophorus ferrugineus]
MKLLLVLFTVTIVVAQIILPPEIIKMLLRYNNECKTESGATPQMIMAAIGGEIEDNPMMRQHLICLGKKLNYIDADGHLQRDSIKIGMMRVLKDETKIDNALDKCLVDKDTSEDTVFNAIKCISDNRDSIMG